MLSKVFHVPGTVLSALQKLSQSSHQAYEIGMFFIVLILQIKLTDELSNLVKVTE